MRNVATPAKANPRGDSLLTMAVVGVGVAVVLPTTPPAGLIMGDVRLEEWW